MMTRPLIAALPLILPSSAFSYVAFLIPGAHWGYVEEDVTAHRWEGTAESYRMIEVVDLEPGIVYFNFYYAPGCITPKIYCTAAEWVVHRPPGWGGP
jgi:hypothetical protein